MEQHPVDLLLKYYKYLRENDIYDSSYITFEYQAIDPRINYVMIIFGYNDAILEVQCEFLNDSQYIIKYMKSTIVCGNEHVVHEYSSTVENMTIIEHFLQQHYTDEYNADLERAKLLFC